MIYQCFHRPEHKARLFHLPGYRGFGLEPVVNHRITRRCPELADLRTRTYLNEYGAMLHLWRNRPYDLHTWIGLTSFRQLDKTPFVFKTRGEIAGALRRSEIAGWGFHDVSNMTCNGLTGAEAQLELCHPGGLAYLSRVLAEFGHSVPDRFRTDQYVLYANFWIMRKRLFREFMNFSWPMVSWMLRTCDEFDFAKKHPRSIGFTMERIFIVWYMTRNAKMLRLGPQPIA